MSNEHRTPRRKWYRLSLGFCAAVPFLAAGLYFSPPARALLEPQVRSVLPVMAAPAPPPPPLAPTGLYEGTQDVAVLMYHDVLDGSDVYFDVSPRELKRQFEQLKAAGANVIPLADLYEHFRNGKELPPRAVVLTFD